MIDSIFIQLEFFLWILFSIVLAFGVGLIGISGVTVFLLQRLADLARLSPALSDDRLFASEISVALYLRPAVFAGIGVNTISHVLVTHLVNAERAFDKAGRALGQER